MKHVLVAYGSKYGSTSEIAEKIAEDLRTASLQVSVLPASCVSDLTPFDAVVLGSAVYAGHWTKEAVSFLETHEKALAKRPVWFFSSGPTGTSDPVERMHGWRFPEAQQAIADRIQPQATVLFHGKIDLSTMNFGEKLIVRALGAPIGDFRDWNAITAFAHHIEANLQPLQPPKPVAVGQAL
jgi:menaquinone-dependent protoporphyrinogen oxidase